MSKKCTFGAPQVKIVEQHIETNGMAYLQEKIAVVNSEARPNATRTFLAALKDDWKLPVKRKPIRTKAPTPPRKSAKMSDESLR